MPSVAMIDMQKRLVQAMADRDEIVAAASKLLQVARILDHRIVVTEQNPLKLGSTLAALQMNIDTPTIAKMEFDASARLADAADGPWIVAGCEAHICILQTVRGLLEKGQRVIVAADAIGSRKPFDKDIALRNLAHAGAEVSTVEAILFGWLGSAGHPDFREVSRLIK